MFVDQQLETSPITIIENDNVRSCQVNAKTSSAGSQQKDELFAIWFIVLVDCDDSVVVCSATVNSAIPWEQGATSNLLQLHNSA
jgi:hypothetical protein